MDMDETQAAPAAETEQKAPKAPRARKASEPKAPKAAKASKTAKAKAEEIPEPKSTTIRAEAEALLQKPLSYEEIRQRLLAAFPGAQTSVKSIQWYASRMKASGAKLPERPKKVKAA